MNNTIQFGSEGTSLRLFTQEQFTNWLMSQSLFTKNWLENTKYSGKGLALIPNETGALGEVVFVDNDLEQYFATSSLYDLLPAGNYVLICEPEHLKPICFSWLIASYNFDRYKDKNVKDVCLVINDKRVVEEATIMASATFLTRDLINTPAQDMMPEDLADECQSLVKQYGGSFSQVVGDELLEQNYPTIHAVGRASCHAPRLLDIRWGSPTAPQVTLVGKGVCFDSGGLDIKPSAGMRLMKKDMGGAAHVLGLTKMIMAFGLNVQLRVLIPAVENAVAGNSFRPGDVIKTRKGLTVEIDNTDAEGRLVLCDALDEAMNDKPDLVIDFATLTGAMRVALGTELPGFFASKDSTADGITKCGLPIQDPVWQMPLHKPYKDMLKSEIADMTNCASGPFGGAITAALYLQEFIEQDTDWVHFDVMAYNIRKLPGRPIGGEAFGIRAVYDYLAQRFGYN